MSKINAIIIVLLSTICSSIELNQLYTQDTILLSGNEYILNADVIIDTNVTVEIPNNINITFNGSYTLTVRGTLIIGCNDIDTLNIHDIGLADPNSFVWINSNKSEFSIPIAQQIVIESTGSASICNTRFQKMFGVFYQSSNEIIIDNCEFYNNFLFAIYLYDMASSTAIITDNIFEDNQTPIWSQFTNTLIENNLFVASTTTLGTGTAVEIGCCYHYATIINNTFILSGDISMADDGDYVGVQVRADSTIYVEYNQFIDYYTGVGISSESNGDGLAYIKYNTFINNEKAIEIDGETIQYINYNNFIDCAYIMQLDESVSVQTNCNYNYYGSASSDENILSQKFLDICSGFGTGNVFFLQCQLFIK